MNKRTAKRTSIILASFLFVLVFILTSCSSANIGDTSYKSGPDADYNLSTPEYGSGTDYGDVILPNTDNADGKGVSGGAATDYARKVIRTYEISGETKEYDATMSRVLDTVTSAGGYIGQSNTTGKSYNYRSDSFTRRAVLVIRIPAEKLDEFIGQIGSMINVTSSSSNAQDVSEAYYNIEARMETLEAERESLLNMMKSIDNATQYDFWYKLQTRVSEIEQAIAEYKATLRNYDNRVDYSTVTLTLNEVLELTPTEKAEPTFGERLIAAFKGSWTDFGEGWMNFSVFLVEALPTLILLAAIVLAIIFIIRGVIRHGRKKKAARAENANRQ